jgi:hypothetical protein
MERNLDRKMLLRPRLFAELQGMRALVSKNRLESAVVSSDTVHVLPMFIKE